VFCPAVSKAEESKYWLGLPDEFKREFRRTIVFDIGIGGRFRGMAVKLPGTAAFVDNPSNGDI